MNRKTAFFTGLSFGSFMTAFYILQPLLFKEGNEEMNWTKNIVAGVLGGLFAGFFFGIIMYWFANSKWTKPKTGIQLQPDEKILYETGANHFTG